MTDIKAGEGHFEEMFRWYRALGGNGTVANLVRELDGLPTKRME